MGQRVSMGQSGAQASLTLDPATGLIDWSVAGGRGAKVYIRGPGDPWGIYAQCGTGGTGVCGQRRNEPWFTPESNLDFRIFESNGSEGEELLLRSVRAGAVAAPATAAIASGASSAGAPADGSPAPSWFWQSTIIAGLSNAYVVGGGVLAGLILARGKR